MRNDLEKIFLMGLGAMAMTNEKAKDLKDELLKKGEELYKKGENLNAELKHKLKDDVTIVNYDFSKENIIKQIKNMSEEDKKAIMDVIKPAKKDTKKNND